MADTATTQTIPHQEIGFGPTYRAELEAFAGQPIGVSGDIERGRVIRQCIYETPRWQARQLDDGRILHVTEKVFSSHVYLFPDRDSWELSNRATMLQVRDPETGRMRS